MCRRRLFRSWFVQHVPPCPEELVVKQQPSAKGDVMEPRAASMRNCSRRRGLCSKVRQHKEVGRYYVRASVDRQTLLRDMIYGDTPMHQFVLAQDPVPGLPTGDSTSPYFRAAFSIADADADAPNASRRP